MKKFKIGVIGLGGAGGWVEQIESNRCPQGKVSIVFDKNPERTEEVAEKYKVIAARNEDEFFEADTDIIEVGTPDNFHVEHSIKAMSYGKHVVCEKPLAPTVKDCIKIVKAVKKYKKRFVTGQVCRHTPAFKLTKKLLEDKQIGDVVFMESEYYHDYSHAEGVDGWRKDPKIKREGFIGGGCHALDLIRWLVGDPVEVFCYMNHKFLTDWPTNDTGVAIFKFKNNVIGKVFVSIGVKAGYSMRTVVHGTEGSIFCDNQSDRIKMAREKYRCVANPAGRLWEIPVGVRSHDNAGEMNELIESIKKGGSPPTNEIEGTKSIMFGEAALESARTGKPVRIDYTILKKYLGE